MWASQFCLWLAEISTSTQGFGAQDFKAPTIELSNDPFFDSAHWTKENRIQRSGPSCSCNSFSLTSEAIAQFFASVTTKNRKNNKNKR